MESPTMTMTTQPSSAPSSNHENPLVKFLCSFSGSILPRPKDGKLRYVGGETRIVSVPRDITYEELMGKMRELFEAATVLKYQQPDEDLDALVSVVNDDDVTNMMEEYDKLGSCDGFTRLRIFLFSHLDQDASVHFGAGAERDSERRYVDALNSLNESPESWKQQLSDFQVTGAADDIHSTEQYFNQMSIEGSLYDQRNFDIPQINLHHLTIPQMGSGQHQQSIMDPSWSPTCYSPRQPGHHDSRLITEFLTSPTSAVYRTPYGDFTDKNSDRMPEEYKRHPVSHQSSYDPQSRSDNLVYVPTGPVSNDKSCFPWNKTHGPGVFEGNSICENCRVAFQRNQAYPDSTWKYGEPAQLEAHSVIGNGFHPVPSPCGECLPNREMVMLNACTKLPLPFYPRELNDPRLVCNETQTHDRGWILQPHLNSSVDEPRSHISGVGRLNDHYTIDSNAMNIPIENGNLSDGHYLSQHYVHHEDPRLLRPGPDMANEAFHDQAFAAGSHIHIPLEDRGGRYGNLPYAYGMDNHHQMSHGHGPPHTLWRNVHNPVHGPPFELSSFPQQKHGMVGPGLMRGTLEGSPLYPVSVESQSPLVESSQKTVGTDGPNVSEYSHSHSLKCNPNTYNQEHQYPHTQGCIQSPYDTLNISAPSCPMPLTDSTKSLIGEKLVSPITSVLEPTNDNQVNGSTRLEKDLIHREKETNKVEDANMKIISGPELNNNSNKVASLENIISTCLGPSMDSHSVMKGEENDVQVPCEDERPANVHLSFLSGLIESVKKAAIGGIQEVKASVQENPESFVLNETQKEEIQHEPEATWEVDLDSDNDNSSNTKIEPTQAEAEAIAKGLQTIKNDDLEEIRELGFGTYGAVYHGKWRGSDVAIKRIKASCFAGKPSERDRLIADFWKEALILSSLHHPNVVSFYGIVRDGPDGSLATVTEFMVNGSLKQFLRKKDRTIDRRKRLIIAMDAAFGMEYLHGKNIVHFDLKCENLLVNMRDTHRPVCKIGDLGLSKVKQHTLVSGGVRGTLPWMAPELLSGKSNMVTEKVDVYSFGVVMWELLTGDEPYADMHCASIIGGIVNNSLRPEIPSWCDPEWKALMESCWASDPAQRPSFSEISQRLRNMAAAINVK